jgi:hypothetical protein
MQGYIPFGVLSHIATTKLGVHLIISTWVPEDVVAFLGRGFASLLLFSLGFIEAVRFEVHLFPVR